MYAITSRVQLFSIVRDPSPQTSIHNFSFIVIWNVHDASNFNRPFFHEYVFLDFLQIGDHMCDTSTSWDVLVFMQLDSV